MEGLLAEGHPGTWCYYLYVLEEMYPHRWSDFACRHAHGEFGSEGPAWESVEFDSEITFVKKLTYYSQAEGRHFEAVKVGCDYAHLWHRRIGFPDTYESVRADAQRTVHSLLLAHPDYRRRCKYSGIWDEPSAFYETVGGFLVHRTKMNEIPATWKAHQPASDSKSEG
jgi:hypothetical protein